MSNTVESFVKRVLALVKGGDESKVVRFQQKAVKFCKNQIKKQNDVLEKLKDKREDVQESYDDALVAVDMKSIATAEGTNQYIPHYLETLSTFNAQLDNIGAQEEVANEQIAKYTALIEKLS